MENKNLEWLIEKYISFLKSFGMNESNIRAYYDTWKKDNGKSIEDYLWFIFNNLLNENDKQSNNLIEFYQRNLKIYSEMIDFRRRVEGKKANEIQALYNYTRVNIDLESGSLKGLERHFKIIGCNDCNEAKRVSGQSLTIEQALENKTIPYSRCTRRQGCVCSMMMVPKRDEKGNLIRKK